MERGGLLIILLACLVLASCATADYLDLRWNYTVKSTVRQLYIGDLDNDGMKDIVAGVSEEKISGSAGWVYLLNRDGGKTWEYSNMPAIAAMLVDDLNNDGKKEVIVGVLNNIFFINQAGEKDASLIIPGPNQFGVVDMLADDIDNDGKKELVVTANSNGGGKILVYGANHIKKWDKDLKEKVTSVYASDINNDNLKELIIGTNGKGGDMNKPGKVYALDPGKGTEIWNFDTAKGVDSVVAEDVDADGSVEIIAGCEDNISILTSKGQQKKTVMKQGSARAVKVADLDKSGSKYILVGSNDVYAYDKDLNPVWKGGLNNEVYGLEVADVDGDGKQEILAESDKFYVLGKDGNMLYNYGTRLPVISIATGDLYDDGSVETVLGSLDQHVYVLESKSQAKMLNATRDLSKATTLFLQGNYSAARESLASAKKVYSELGAFGKIKECEALYTQINNYEIQSQRKKAEADAEYTLSYNAFMARDYRNATLYAEIAKNKYPTIEADSIARCNEISKNSKDFLKSEADGFLENATSALERKDYDNAYNDAKKANDSYSFLRDEASVNKTAELMARIKEDSGGLEEIKQQAPPQNPQSDNTALIIIACVVLVIALISFWAVKQARKNTTPKLRDVIEEDAIIDDVEKGMKKREAMAAKAPAKKVAAERPAAAEPAKKAVREPATTLPEQTIQQEIARSGPVPEKKAPERKPPEKIAKDGFRGHGASLKNLVTTHQHRAKEEDISD